MISGHATVQIAVEAIRLGAYEFITKPFAPEQLLNFISRGLENINLKKENSNLEGINPWLYKNGKLKIDAIKSACVVNDNKLTGSDFLIIIAPNE